MLLAENKNTVMRFSRIRGSITLEASLVIPLYMYAVLAVMFVIRLLNTYVDVDRAAYNSVRELSKYAYLYNQQNSMELLNAQVYTAFYKNLGLSYGTDNYIVGNTAGFVLAGSEIANDNSRLRLNVSYIVKNPFDIFGLGLIKVRQEVWTEAWLGQKASGDWNVGNEETKVVYVTPWGSVYHTDKSCPYLNLTITAVGENTVDGLRNIEGAKYYCCEECKDVSGDGIVYITDYGTRFHKNKDCQGLKRTVQEVELKDVGGINLCQKCGGNHGS